MNLFEYDESITADASAIICGTDEAGRGPLAGPVFAAAVILPPGCEIEGLNDSKKLTEKKREKLFDEITEKAAAYSIAQIDAGTIDKINILQASLLAMRNAVAGLGVAPGIVLVDGNADPKFELEAETRLVIGGDAKSACIAAASVLAKVSRDRYMLKLHEEYPRYGFDKHKGYGTKAHYAALDAFGACPEHRESFLKKWRAAKNEA